jgi:hypothetical protein
MPTPAELNRLLALPNETLAVEYKSWLVLSENHGRATLAKAAIALANHGGGIVVLGMRPMNAEGGALVSEHRPAELRRYSQDDINAAINRFADPPFHCELAFATHAVSGVEHAFVVVPGGSAVPVMSTRACPNVIEQQRCYIRKPGPRSEEPFTGAEWRSLFERCLSAGRENMLGAIRAIVHGRAGGSPDVNLTALDTFVGQARERWETLIEGLPADDAARMPLGHYEQSFEIRDTAAAPNLLGLRRRMDAAGAIKHTGWGPFVTLGREPFEVRPAGGVNEVWLGAPDGSRFERTPAHCDFWQAHPAGRLYLQRGYDEDGYAERIAPGTGIDITLPIWRVGEAMLYAGRLARLYAENPPIVFRCRFVGLRDRALFSASAMRMMGIGNRRCHDDEAVLETQVSAAEIEDNLAEIIHPLLAPLYERFSFFELPLRLVVEELEAMRRNRF